MSDSRFKVDALQKKGKKLVLPLFFCIITLFILWLIALPIGASISQAANHAGFGAIEPTVNLFDGSPNIESGTVDLNRYGGYPQEGENYGRLVIQGTSIDCNLFYGDSPVELSSGAGTYAGASIPGEGSTVLIAGHTSTYFRDFDRIEKGTVVSIETSYGKYLYEVTDMRVADADDTSAYDLTADEDNLILYTCYPFGQVSPTEQRYFVYAKWMSGPTILKDTSHET